MASYAENVPTTTETPTSRVRYPRRIFLDDFVEQFRRRGGWTPRMCYLPLEHRGRLITVPDQPHPIYTWDMDHPAIAAGIEEQLARLRQARVVVITKPLMDVVMQAAQEIVRRFWQQGRLSLPRLALTPLPATPQWIEFDGFALGDEAFPIKGLWFDDAAHFLRGDDRWKRGITWLVPPETVCVGLYENPWEMKELWLYRDGHASIHQTGACANTTCPIARTTEAGKGYVLHTGEHADTFALCAARQKAICECYVNAWEWQIILYCLFAYLRMEHLEAPEVVRYHVEAPPMKRKASGRQETLAAVEAWNRARPAVYRRVSLTQPRERVVRVRRLAEEHLADVETAQTAPAQQPTSQRTEIVERRVEPHVRLLVAGPGLRWRKTQLVEVAAHTRRYHAGPRADRSRVRIIAEP